MNAERILQNLFARDAEQRFDTKVKCPTGQASLWVKFPTVWSKTPVKCPGYALGGGVGGRWAVMELIGTLQSYQLLRQRVRQFNLCPANKQETERNKLNLVTVLLK